MLASINNEINTSDFVKALAPKDTFLYGANAWKITSEETLKCLAQIITTHIIHR